MKNTKVIKSIIYEVIGYKKNLNQRHTFVKDLDFSITDLAELYNGVEGEFNIEFTKSDEEKINCIADLIQIVEMKLNKNELNWSSNLLQ